jgi:hypothetical protein
MVRIAAALLLTGFSLAAGPAAAQFGGIFGGSSPPRPPADVPNGGFPAQPPPVYPGQAPPPYAAPVYQPSYTQPPPNQSPYPQYPSQPSASQSPYAPPPSAGAPPPTIQAQPLPPPPGASPAPAPAASAPDAGGKGTPQQATTGTQPGSPSSPEPADTAPPDDTIITEMPTAKIANGRAVFSGLDKITGRTISFDAAIGETVQFGALRVTPRVCYTRPPTEATNTDAFVQVDEVTLKGEIKRIFSGWMFAASPGLHAVEHPIYDVWLTDCAAPPSSPVADSTPPPAPAAPQRTRQATPRQAPPRAPAPAAAPVTDD